MNKMKIKFGFILFLLLIVRFNTSLSAEGKNNKLFLNIGNANFRYFTFGAGVELRIFKFVSIKASMDFLTDGGRIYYLDAAFPIKASKRIKPFFTIGYLDYSFGGDYRYDSETVKTVTIGFVIDFYSKNGKTGSSLGVRFARAEGSDEPIGQPIIYWNLILLRF